MSKKQALSGRFQGIVNELYLALGLTLAFRRWNRAIDPETEPIPGAGCRYRFRVGSVLRSGRIVEKIRPLGVTLHEVLLDSPCRVVVTMRWRIEPVPSGCVVRLGVTYRLNQAAALRARHWDRRLTRHFRNQFTHLGRNLASAQASSAAAADLNPKRDLAHH